MIVRTFNPPLVNWMLARDGLETDFTEVLAEPQHVCLVEDDSGAIFCWRGPGIYELHLFFAVRGRKALDLLTRMLAEISEEYGGRFFWAAIPEENRRTRLFARLMGWKSLGSRQNRFCVNELFVSESASCLQS